MTYAVVNSMLSVARLLISLMFKFTALALNHNNSVAICAVFKVFKQTGY